MCLPTDPTNLPLQFDGKPTSSWVYILGLFSLFHYVVAGGRLMDLMTYYDILGSSLRWKWNRAQSFHYSTCRLESTPEIHNIWREKGNQPLSTSAVVGWLVGIIQRYLWIGYIIIFGQLIFTTVKVENPLLSLLHLSCSTGECWIGGESSVVQLRDDTLYIHLRCSSASKKEYNYSRVFRMVVKYYMYMSRRTDWSLIYTVHTTTRNIGWVEMNIKQSLSNRDLRDVDQMAE